MSVFDTSRGQQGIVLKKGKFYYTPIERLNTFVLGSSHLEYDKSSNDYVPVTIGLLFLDRFNKLNLNEFEVEDNQEGRPDLIAYDLYGDPDYWRWISVLNDMDYWEDFTIGLHIKVPSKQALDTFLNDHLNFLSERKRNANRR